MTVLKLMGNVVSLGATGNVVSIDARYGGNSTSGAQMLYLYNGSTGSANVTVAPAYSNGTLQANVGLFTIGTGQSLFLEKGPYDIVFSSNTLVVATPIAKSGS